MGNQNVRAVVIGVSAGGLDALHLLFSKMPGDFHLPVLVVQHISANSDNFMVEYLNNNSPLTICEASEKERILPGCVYIAPPNYHLLVEMDETISLSVDEKVNYARPSLDVLFETAAYCFGNQLVAIILTGANSDGAEGIRIIKSRGGITIAQNPKTAEVSTMPEAAIKTGSVDYVLDLEDIPAEVLRLTGYKKNN